MRQTIKIITALVALLLLSSATGCRPPQGLEDYYADNYTLFVGYMYDTGERHSIEIHQCNGSPFARAWDYGFLECETYCLKNPSTGKSICYE